MAKIKVQKTLFKGAEAWLDSEANVKLLANLYERWRDEREYEDFSEYEKVLEKSFIPYFPFLAFQATKRPFGFCASDCNEAVWVQVRQSKSTFRISLKHITG